MRNTFLLSLIFSCSIASAQFVQPERRAFQISAGLGVDAMSSHSVFTYINTLFGVPSTQTLGGLIPATEFFIVPEYQITDHWLVGFEYSYLLVSKSVAGYYAGEYSESIHMPMMIAHYCLHGEGYWLKCGGGIGYNFGTLTQTFTDIGSEETFAAQGAGMKLEAVMNLAFDEHWYGMLSGDVRWGIGNTFADHGTKADYQSVSPQLNYITVGMKLGMMYQF
ncbi:MAG TPA: hypothetical protein VMU30_05305 [Bacteroidota bacterium]|nr:hypothetical protein [Bacteroidota bacterium]